MVIDPRIKAIESLVNSWEDYITINRLGDLAVNEKYIDWSLKLYETASKEFSKKRNLINKVSNDRYTLLQMILQYGVHLHGLIRDYGDPDLVLGVHGGVPYFKGIQDIELWGFTNPIITRIGKSRMKFVNEEDDRYTRDDIRGIVTLVSYSLPAHRLVLPTVMAKLEEDGCKILYRNDD